MEKPDNLTLFQSFHWYLPADGNFWNHIAEIAPELLELGIDFIWLPPAYKSCDGANGVGYGVYDLYDLGEFDQQFSVRTKYGTKDEYVRCVQELQKNDIKVLVDVVMNHKMSADETETVLVTNQDSNNRGQDASEPYDKEVLTKFTFPGRQGKYSEFIWDFMCFTGVNDKDDQSNNNLFYRIVHNGNEGWDEVPSKEFGNFDYLMGADIEFRNPAVREELKRWGEWYYNTVKFDGMRLDAVKHMNPQYVNEWIEHVKHIAGKDMMVIAEDWTMNVEELVQYMDITQGKIQLFDVPLHYNFHRASTDGGFNMATILDGTLMKEQPQIAITFVENHDTQPLQMLESPVDYWFQPLAYSLILTREQGIPCVFHTSLFGAKYTDKGQDGQDHEVELVPPPSTRELMKVRKYWAFGLQRDYLDHPNVIGWTREGMDEMDKSGCAVVLSNGDEGFKDMEIGKRHSGQQFVDMLGNRKEEVTINEDGYARFGVNGRSVSVGVRKDR